MKAIISAAALALVGLGGPGHAIPPRAAHALAVRPHDAASLRVFPLGDFVAKALPRGGKLQWDWLRDGSIRWLTEGTRHWPTGQTTRTGIARIRASGRAARIRQQRWEELAWGVELSTDGDPKRGPTSIMIEPGFHNAAK